MRTQHKKIKEKWGLRILFFCLYTTFYPTGVTMENADEDGVDEIADPLARAVALKNKGNKYFKGGRYSQAVKCYSEAIDNCPKENKSDLSTFYQNRAAAYEQMVR